ncbi:MAG: SH3 domain-containing protein, partial [Anaerolineae bacterium]|nr:SH3 domain-containing protein [Anaerolineae bacterium]
QVMVEQQRCFTASGSLNLRSGPGTVYDPPIASLPAGAEVKPLAYSAVGYPDDQWVKVQVVGSGEEGWVASSFLAGCNVDVAGLGGATIPPTPTPAFTVNNVQAKVTPETFSGPCPKQFDFTADITVNGVGTVEYAWERSDGGAVASQTVNFAAAGTKSVNTSWSLSSVGEKWMRLRVTAPSALVSNQATFELTCISEAVYIYNTDLTLAQQYKQLLDPNGFDFDIIKMSSILAANLNNYKLILVGPDTGTSGTWGDNAGTQANKLADSSVPVVGLGEGGYAFFGKLNSPIGWGNGAHGSARDVYVMDSDDSAWNKPNDINIPSNHIVQLYNSNSDFVAIYYPNPIAGITGIGRQTTGTVHYAIIEENVNYILWGFDAGPLAMTSTGEQIFVNTAKSAMERRFFLIQPVLIDPPILQLNP